MDRFSEDQIIRTPFFDGPVRIKKFEQRRAFSKLDVIVETTGEYRSLQLTENQLAQVEHVQQNPAALSSDLEEFFLLIEANRIRLAH